MLLFLAVNSRRVGLLHQCLNPANSFTGAEFAKNGRRRNPEVLSATTFGVIDPGLQRKPLWTAAAHIFTDWMPIFLPKTPSKQTEEMM